MKTPLNTLKRLLELEGWHTNFRNTITYYKTVGNNKFEIHILKDYILVCCYFETFRDNHTSPVSWGTILTGSTEFKEDELVLFIAWILAIENQRGISLIKNERRIELLRNFKVIRDARQAKVEALNLAIPKMFVK